MNIEEIINNSAFSKSGYIVSIPLKRFNTSIFEYISINEEYSNVERFLKLAIPDFQRSNDKWTQTMKISFIENVIKGYKSKILLFNVNSEENKIIDGLQRTTALLEFLNGDFKIFDNTIAFEDIKDTILRGMNKNIEIEIFSFNSEKEAVNFYIEMNENISHSKEDILKAKKYLKKLSE